MCTPCTIISIRCASARRSARWPSANTAALQLTARYKKLQLKTVLPQLEKGLSALVYTQLTDVEDEVNGLFTYDRAAVKPDANAVRSVNAALAAEFARVTNPAKK